MGKKEKKKVGISVGNITIITTVVFCFCIRNVNLKHLNHCAFQQFLFLSSFSYSFFRMKLH